jgi:hypothetical protein
MIYWVPYRPKVTCPHKPSPFGGIWHTSCQTKPMGVAHLQRTRVGLTSVFAWPYNLVGEASMASIRLSRDARNRWRQAVVLAMLPLAVLNGRTVAGCGCSGRFEAICQCGCGDSESGRGLCEDYRSTPCTCCKNLGKCHSEGTQDSNAADKSFGINGHHCKGFARHEVIPATVVSVHMADGPGFSDRVLDTIHLPATITEESVGLIALEHSTPPPSDLVVLLRRLII